MRYVIIGGDAAGMSAAMQIVRQDQEAKVTTLEMGVIYSYAQCGLPYLVGGIVDSSDSLIARDVETFRNKYGIDARVNHEVKHVDTEHKRVSGDDFEVEYDKLLIATGASPIMPPWDGSDLKGIHTIKTIQDTEALLADLTEDVRHVVVIGGGYIGLEMVENLVEISKQVTLVQRGSQLATIFDEDLAEKIHDEAKSHGVELRLNESVKGFKGENYVSHVVTDKGNIKADVVIVATGVKPNTSFLQDTGIHLHPNGAIKVNHFMETNIEDIYAAGDCATQYHRVKKRDDYIPLGTHANKQGRIAGLVMVGKPKPFQGVVGTSILKFFNLTLARTGLSSREIEKQGYPYQTVTIDSRDIAGYYPTPEQMTIRLCYHTETEQLLGGQIIGKAGVDKRIDVLATALFHEMRIGELEDLDLAYAPPYNGVWDPIQQTARRR
ncbi:FAD-dependent oxidoreductase [Halalkalibacter nanhaiisediminis]|uniref:NADPH-dependent 2,4-dienoyl-CoA reductase/sulfur reductase-like enzyme n=1 Tax=Halalkalibacter nanhaiisediminis TaxID=688079 RepID=A0A562QSP6_9BACI|nr:FAD-dependent oxidoreductase [Halalkalibacter nanhaiisediminis]TWI59772.1 NADPH-dependent 2,4-dienoyl-CoA reductase/sulfur reductase-like enzyme [Halalkalibacter nanhaiisediminis]